MREQVQKLREELEEQESGTKTRERRILALRSQMLESEQGLEIGKLHVAKLARMLSDTFSPTR